MLGPPPCNTSLIKSHQIKRHALPLNRQLINLTWKVIDDQVGSSNLVPSLVCSMHLIRLFNTRLKQPFQNGKRNHFQNSSKEIIKTKSKLALYNNYCDNKKSFNSELSCFAVQDYKRKNPQSNHFCLIFLILRRNPTSTLPIVKDSRRSFPAFSTLVPPTTQY